MMSVEQKEDMSSLGPPVPALRINTPTDTENYKLLNDLATHIDVLRCRYMIRPATGYGTSFRGMAVQMQHEHVPAAQILGIDYNGASTSTYTTSNKFIYITTFTQQDATRLAFELTNRQSTHPLWGKYYLATIETGTVQKCTTTGVPQAFAKEPSRTPQTISAPPTHNSESEFPTLSKCQNDHDKKIRNALGVIGYNLRVTMGACSAQQEYDGIQQACTQMGVTVDQLRQYLHAWSDTTTLVEKVKSWDVQATPAEDGAPPEYAQKPAEAVEPTNANKNERRALQPVNGDRVPSSPVSLIECPATKNDNDQKKQQMSVKVPPGLPICQMLAQIRFELGTPSANLPDLENMASSDIQYSSPAKGTVNAHERVKMLYDYVCAH